MSSRPGLLPLCTAAKLFSHSFSSCRIAVRMTWASVTMSLLKIAVMLLRVPTISESYRLWRTTSRSPPTRVVGGISLRVSGPRPPWPPRSGPLKNESLGLEYGSWGLPNLHTPKTCCWCLRRPLVLTHSLKIVNGLGKPSKGSNSRLC